MNRNQNRSKVVFMLQTSDLVAMVTFVLSMDALKPDPPFFLPREREKYPPPPRKLGIKSNRRG